MTMSEFTADELQGALVALYLERLAALRADFEARAWGGVGFEAAFDVLGTNAIRDEIEALMNAAGHQP
jgi:hypothetical protein